MCGGNSQRQRTRPARDQCACYLGQYVGVGNLLPHDRTDLRLPLDFIERRLAALPPPRPRRAVESSSGNGPEISGRPLELVGPAVLDAACAFAFVFVGAALGDGDAGAGADEEDRKSHVNEKKPERPLAFFGGGGDVHELGSCRSSSLQSSSS